MYENFSSLRDSIENPPYELSENSITKETKSTIELFFHDYLAEVLFAALIITLLPHYFFNCKESKTETSNPPPEQNIRILVR